MSGALASIAGRADFAGWQGLCIRDDRRGSPHKRGFLCFRVEDDHRRMRGLFIRRRAGKEGVMGGRE